VSRYVFGLFGLVAFVCVVFKSFVVYHKVSWELVLGDTPEVLSGIGVGERIVFSGFIVGTRFVSVRRIVPILGAVFPDIPKVSAFLDVRMMVINVKSPCVSTIVWCVPFDKAVKMHIS